MFRGRVSVNTIRKGRSASRDALSSCCDPSSTPEPADSTGRDAFTSTVCWVWVAMSDMSVVLVGVSSILATVAVLTWFARPVEFRNTRQRRWRVRMDRT